MRGRVERLTPAPGARGGFSRRRPGARIAGGVGHRALGDRDRFLCTAGAQQKPDQRRPQLDVARRAAETLAQQRLGPTVVEGHRRRFGEDGRVGVLGARRPREPFGGLTLTEPRQHASVVEGQPAIVGAVRAAHLDRLPQLASGVGQLPGRRVDLAERGGGAPPEAAVEGQRQRSAERIARWIDPSQAGQHLAEQTPGRCIAAVQIDRASERRDRLLERSPPRLQLAKRQKRLRRLGRPPGDLGEERLRACRISVRCQRPRARDLVGDRGAAVAGQLVERPGDAIENSHQVASGDQTFWRISAIRSSIARSCESAASIPAASAVAETDESAARRSRRARSSTSVIPRVRVSPACATNSSRREPNPSMISSSFGPTSAATRSTASGACALASTFTSAATFPRRTRARIGAASVSTPPASPSTKRNTVVPSAPSAKIEASYLSVSTLISTLVSAGPSSVVTVSSTSRTFSFAT